MNIATLLGRSDVVADVTRRHDLTDGEVRDAIRLNQPALVAEVFAFAKSFIAEELARQTRIDTKATSLLGAIGVSISVATFLVTQTKVASAQMVFGVAAALALYAGACAVHALTVTRHYRVSDRTIFNEEVLEDSDNAAEAGAPVALYQRYVLPALWETHVGYVSENDQRAAVVSRGQKSFFAALVVAAVGGGLMVLGQ